VVSTMAASFWPSRRDHGQATQAAGLAGSQRRALPGQSIGRLGFLQPGVATSQPLPCSSPFTNPYSHEIVGVP
jgi:hypothetical protein